jgi:TPR repeat protein
MYRVALFNDSHSEIPKAINQNESTAFKFAFKAASSGHIEAMLLLAGYYLNGVGTDVDREKAKHWHMLHTEAQKKNAANGKKLKIVGGYKDNRCNQM